MNLSNVDWWAVGVIAAALFAIASPILFLKLWRSRRRERSLAINLEIEKRRAEDQRKTYNEALTQAMLSKQQLEQRVLDAERDYEERHRKLARFNEYLTTTPTRIHHDVSKRLEKVAKVVEKHVPKARLAEIVRMELATVAEKIDLHLAEDIEEYVRAQRRENRGGQLADGRSIWDIAEHVLELEQYENVRLEQTTSMPVEGHWVHWELLLTHVITNAVENAKLVDKGEGQVTVTVRRTGDKATIDIVNDGPHVPQAIHESIFDLGVTTKENGRGVGLFVARKIARGLGGELTAPENLTVKRSFWKKSTAVRFSIINLPVSMSDEGIV